MIEVMVDSIRVSLINQHRLVVLREKDSPRYLAIWIGAFEAEAITTGLQGTESPRPLTHDLLRHAIEQLGGRLRHVLVSELSDDTYHACIVVAREGAEDVQVDSRTSDAIALAARAGVPIFVAESVMEAAGQVPSVDEGHRPPPRGLPGRGGEPGDELDVFRSFVEGLDLDPGSSGEPDD